MSEPPAGQPPTGEPPNGEPRTGESFTGGQAVNELSTQPSTHEPVESSFAAPVRPSWFKSLLGFWCLRAVVGVPRGSAMLVSAALSVCLLVAWILIDRWQQQPDPQFSPGGIPLLAWYALAALGLASVLRGLCRPRPPLSAALVLALGLVPLPLILVSVVIYYIPAPALWWAGGAVAVYGAAYLMRGLHSLTGRPQRTAALVGIALSAAFLWSSDAVDAIPDLWLAQESLPSGAVSEDTLSEREAALFAQEDRIDAALEPMHRDIAAGAQAFFLGFAGVGDQKVFAQEIGLASRVLAERYRIADRSFSLINDERDLERAPIASVTGLTYALQGLAQRMDLDKDVLILAISSHGSRDPSIAVENSQFPLTALTPDDLKDALREAGIRWRVIIISACYAGGFIDALRDPRSIVLTAAAKDRTSFGCSNDSDLTYFGEAFYRDALPGAKSLRDAFDAAKKAIAERERGERETPSEPQAFFGRLIENKLADMYGEGQARR